MTMTWDPRFKKIFECVSGSQLYGTALPTSDTDIRGVFIPSAEFYLGTLEHVEQVETTHPDVTHFELRKFLSLCADCNPNIIELLFVPVRSSYCKLWGFEWQTILEHRMAFLSTKARYTFAGYAVSQLRQINREPERILNNHRVRGIKKLKVLLSEDKITVDWLSRNFDSKIIDAVLS